MTITLIFRKKLEAKTKKSIINFELLNTEDKNQNHFLEEVKNLVQPFTGIEEDLSWVKYNEETGVFQIFFNGDPLNQLKILRILTDNGFKVIEFSVPKAGLLEDLFIELTKPKV